MAQGRFLFSLGSITPTPQTNTNQHPLYSLSLPYIIIISISKTLAAYIPATIAATPPVTILHRQHHLNPHQLLFTIHYSTRPKTLIFIS